MLPALALSAAGCAGTVDYPARSALTVRASVHQPETAALELASVQVESRDGRVHLDGVTDEAGEASFDVWWSEGPYAVTVTSPEVGYPLTAVGLDEANAHQDLWTWAPPDIGDAVLVGGTATHRTPDTVLVVVAHPGNDSFSTEGHDFVVAVPRGEPFTLVALQAHTLVRGGEWVLEVESWTVQQYPGAVDDISDLELDLSISPGAAHTATLDTRWPVLDGIDVQATVVAGVDRQGLGWDVARTATGDRDVQLDMEWIRPWPDETYSTAVVGWPENSDEGAQTQCVVDGTPDEVEERVELLPFPAFVGRPAPAGPLRFAAVPERATPMVWFQAAYTWDRLWQVEWRPGQDDDLWLPAAVSATTLQGQVYAHPVLWDVPEPTDGRLLGCWAFPDSTLVTAP